MKKPKVFVGLSGGVDSAVSAALLKNRGFDVTGVFIKVWHPDFLPCAWREERRDAMRVAAHLDIPFLFFDFEKEYKENVADYMINEYKAGRTPNPDVLCNRVIKFGSFWDKAQSLGADYIATGHYAKIIDTNGHLSLHEGTDNDKDQSYFLWMLKQDELSHILFPVGDLNKSEVRSLASQVGIPVSSKKDSQGICFVGDISMEDFLSHFIETQPGNVLNTNGEIIGTHRGSALYTIGERKGLDIYKKTPHTEAMYVVSKDLQNNTLTVANLDDAREDFSPTKVVVSNLNWINPPKSTNITGRIRYRQNKVPLKILSPDFIEKNEIQIEFDYSQIGLSLGQSLVFYEGHNCLGGGIMKNL